MTAPELWLTEHWGVVEPDGVGNYRTVENGAFVESLPADAVRLVPAPDVAKLAEMASAIEDAVAWTHNYDGLGDHEDWLIVTARQLRLLAAPVPDNATEETRDGA